MRWLTEPAGARGGTGFASRLRALGEGMKASSKSSDQRALSTLLEMLQYVEREMQLLDMPAPEAAKAVANATAFAKATLEARSTRRSSNP